MYLLIIKQQWQAYYGKRGPCTVVVIVLARPLRFLALGIAEGEHEGQVVEASDHIRGDGQNRGGHGPRLERDPKEAAAFTPVQN
jgi:hypothetical protein